MNQLPELTDRQRQIYEFIQDRIRQWGYPPTIREIGEHLGIKSTNGVADHLKALKRKGYLTQQGMKSRTLHPTTAHPASVARSVSGSGSGVSSAGVYAAAGSAVSATSNTDRRMSLSVGTGEMDMAAAAANSNAAADASDDSAMNEHGRMRAAGVSTASNSVVPTLVTGRGRRLVEIPLLGRVAAGEPILAEEHAEGKVVVDAMLVGDGHRVFALKVVGDSMIDDGIFDGDFIFVKKRSHADAGDIVVVVIENEATVKRFYPEGNRVRLQPANQAMKPIYIHEKDFRQVQVMGVVVGVYRRMAG